YEQQISVCYTIGQDSQVYIDESDLLHTSWQRQNNERVVRFIGISDSEHIWNPDTICEQVTNPCETYEAVRSQIQKEQEISGGSQGRVEIRIYYEGKFVSICMNMILKRSKTVNFRVVGREKTELGNKINLYKNDTIRNVRSEYCDGKTEIGDVTCFSITEFFLEFQVVC
ncbi:MAG: hypothetical protein EZS28_034963, partial [Streblomastix strix]